MRCGHTNALGIAASKNQCAPDGYHTNFQVKRTASEAGRVTTLLWSRPLVSFFSVAITSHQDVERHSDREDLPERSLILPVENNPPLPACYTQQSIACKDKLFEGCLRMNGGTRQRPHVNPADLAAHIIAAFYPCQGRSF